jgi:beta-galactosidase
MNINIGVSYYPEFHCESLWEKDLARMQSLGIGSIRILEFAWGKLQSDECTYTFDWLERFLKLTQKYGMEVILCTPTCCPPNWMLREHPEIHLINADGKKTSHGRKMASPSSSAYRVFCLEIIRRLAALAKGFPNIICWQIDNELGPHEAGPCYGNETLAAYRLWLEKRYGNIETLNQAWQTSQWSHEIFSWADVPIPTHNIDPAPQLAFRRFTQHQIEDFYRFQVQVLREEGVTVPIYTNLMGPIYEGMDYWEFARQVDIVAADLYFLPLSPESNAMGLDIMRNLSGKPFWLSETGTEGGMGATPECSQLRVWALRAIARGARRLVYFRWRTCASGAEYEHPAFLTSSHQETSGVAALEAFQDEIQSVLKQLPNIGMPKAKVALVLDWQSVLSEWRVGEWWSERVVTLEKHILDCYRWFYKRGINVDVVGPHFDPSSYQLVVIAGLANRMTNPALAGRLTEWVKAGGVLAATVMAYSKDGEGNYSDQPNPVDFVHLFGIKAGQRFNLSPVDVKAWKTDLPVVGIQWNGGSNTGSLPQEWIERIELHGAEVEAVYKGAWEEGRPVVVSKIYGNGNTWYAGSVLDGANLDQFLQTIYSRNEWQTPKLLPEGVERVTCGTFEFYFNHSPVPVRIPIQTERVTVLLGSFDDKSVQMNGYDVALIRTNLTKPVSNEVTSKQLQVS